MNNSIKDDIINGFIKAKKEESKTIKATVDDIVGTIKGAAPSEWSFDQKAGYKPSLVASFEFPSKTLTTQVLKGVDKSLGEGFSVDINGTKKASILGENLDTSILLVKLVIPQDKLVDIANALDACNEYTPPEEYVPAKFI